MKTVAEFLEVTGLQRGADKQTVDKAIEKHGIKRGEFIADIYGTLGVDGMEDEQRTVDQLNIDELAELQNAYFGQLLEMDEDVLGDITTAEEIPMENVIAHYEGVYFVKEDFFCNI